MFGGEAFGTEALGSTANAVPPVMNNPGTVIDDICPQPPVAGSTIDEVCD